MASCGYGNGYRAGVSGSWRLGLVVAAAGVAGFPPVKKPHYGYDQAARYLREKGDWKDCVTLVFSEADGEGMLISEMAALENAPRRYLLRASKMLASASWNGADFKMKAQDTGQSIRLLDQSPVNVVVIDSYAYLDSKYHFPHHELLASSHQ